MTYKNAEYYERWKNQVLKAYYEEKIRREEAEAEILSLQKNEAQHSNDVGQYVLALMKAHEEMDELKGELDMATKTASQCQALAEEYRRELEKERALSAEAHDQILKVDEEIKEIKAKFAQPNAMRTLLEQLVYVFNTSRRSNDWNSISNMILKAQKVLGK